MTPIKKRNDCVDEFTQQSHENETALTGLERLVSSVIFTRGRLVTIHL